MVKSFEDIFDVETFTARLEESSTRSRKASCPGAKPSKNSGRNRSLNLDKAGDEMLSYKRAFPTGRKCEKCGQGELLERNSAPWLSSAARGIPTADFIDLSPELRRSQRRTQNRYCDNCARSGH